MASAFDLSGMGSGSSISMQNNPVNLGNGFTGGSRWVNGSLQTANPGYGWDANGNYVNISQAQLGQQAQQQAQQDLNSFGGLTPYQIGQQAAGAADPFASQRPQYQNSLKGLMEGNFDINDPSYKFRFDQGQQALERSQAAKGFLGSGNMLQELQNYGQGMASQEYQNQYNRLLPLTGATTGSPAAAGHALSGLYDWRNNALANLGAGMSMSGTQPLSGGYSNPFLAGSGGVSSGGRGGSSGSIGGSGGSMGGSFGGGGGFGGAPYSPGGGALGTTKAESDAALAGQLAGGGGQMSGGPGGFINAVPTGEEGQGAHAVSNKRGPDGKYYITWSDGSVTLG